MADIPKIRFKGFTEPWEQRKLGDFGKATGGTSIESEFSEDGIYKVISIGSYSENSVYNDQGIRAIKSDKTSNRVLNRNDLTMILNDKTTSGNIIGRVLLIEESGIYVYNQRTERIEINLDEYDSVFLYEMLNAPNIREKIIKQAQGNTQIYVNWTAISLLKYMIPSKEEQVKIGEYLHSISNLITLHQRKCDDTKELKKYMLQKMFPKNGEKFPEIRFKGFTEAWEQRKLGEVLKERTERAKGDEELLSVTIANGVIRQIDSEKRNTASEDRSNYKIVKKGDVPYNSMRMWQGAVGNSKYNGIVSPAYTILTPTSEANGKFFMELFKKKSTLQIFQRWSQGLTSDTWNLKYPILSSIQFAIPSVEEQEKIAEYFSSLDHLITLHQRKCDTLKELKKYMLQNMFPKKG